MPKEDFSIRRISKSQAAEILLRFHYLKDISKGFKSGLNYGCFRGADLVGAVVFTGFPVPELTQGMLGLARSDQDGLFELSRLCLHPAVQLAEHNLASWFVSRAIRQLRKDAKVRCILSYADNDFHSGVVYAASNFKYYGLSAAKKDFFLVSEDGTETKVSRGSVKGLRGEWKYRSQKHRFALTIDDELSVKWPEVKWTKKDSVAVKTKKPKSSQEETKMINKIEKLLDLCIAVAEKHLEGKPGGQMPLPMAPEAPKPVATAENVVEEPKKTRKPRTPKEEPAAAAAPVEPSEGLEDQLGLGGEEPKKEKEMTEEESKARMEEVTKQYVSLCKNDQPEDGKTRAIKLMKETFKVQKLGDLTHAQRLQWIKHMEAGIVAHK